MDDEFHVNLTVCFPLHSHSLNTCVSDISTNEQKKDWFLRLNPNGEHDLRANVATAILFSLSNSIRADPDSFGPPPIELAPFPGDGD